MSEKKVRQSDYSYAGSGGTNIRAAKAEGRFVEATPKPQDVPRPTFANPVQNTLAGIRGQETVKPTIKEDEYNPVSRQDGEVVWDYKTAKADMKGSVPMTYKIGNIDLTPKGFDPNGNVYFGAGITGWIKKLAYKSLAMQFEDSQKLEDNQALIQNGLEQIHNTDFGEVWSNEKGQDVQELGKAAGGAWDVVKGIWGGAVATDPTKGAAGLLTVPVKMTQIGVEGALDVFQSFADTAERVIGLNKTIRDYVEENGSNIPSFAEVDFDPKKVKLWEKEYELNDELVNTFLRSASPILASYDYIRFFSAPGTLKEKTQAVAEGWTENKMLYSELVRPSIEAEYKQRVLAGEDPELLRMELEDPLAELVGELLIDPLNVAAPATKGNKFAKIIKNADKLGGVTDEVIDVLKVISKVSNEAESSAALDKLTTVVKEFGYAEKDGALVQRVFGKLDNKALSLSARGMQVKQTKNMSEFVMWGMGNIKKNGGTMDDALEWLGAVVKLSSKDDAEIKAGITFLNSSKIDAPLAHFSQQALETSHMIRNFMGEGDDVLKFVKKLKTSSWEDQAKLLNEMLGKVAKQAYPSIEEMASAANKMGELDDVADVSRRIKDVQAQLKTALSQKAPQGVKKLKNELKALQEQQKLVGSAKDIRMAQEYAKLVKERPAIAALNKFYTEVAKPIRKINGHLSNVYFTSYGFALRNVTTNTFMMSEEAGGGLRGIKNLYFRDGEFKSISKIEAELARDFPAGLPKVIGDTKPLTETVDEADDIVSRLFKKFKDMPTSPQALAARAEVAGGERVFYKFYRDTMDSMTSKAMPSLDDWRAKGFTPEMADDFSEMFKATGYNAKETSKLFKEKYAGGVDMFRQLDWVQPEIKKALVEADHSWDEVVKFVNDPKITTKEQVSKFIQDMVDHASERAGKAAFDPIGVPDSEALDFIEKFGGNAEELKGFSDLQANVSNVTKNAIGAFRDDFKNARFKAQKMLLEINQEMAAGGKIDPKRQQLAGALNDWVLRADKHTDMADDLYRTNGQKIKEIKNYLDNWLDKNKGLYNYKEGQREVEWQKFYAEVDKANESFFELYNGGGNLLAEDFAKLTGEDATKIFKKSRQATVDMQQARMLVAGKEGGLFHAPPKDLMYSEIGTAGHDGQVAKLADYYGIPTKVSKEGAKLDKMVLNIINKYSTEKYTSLKDVPMEIAGDAFARHQGTPSVDVVGKLKQSVALPEQFGNSVGQLMESTTTVPRSELPPVVSDRISTMAKQLLNELSGGEGKGFTQSAEGGTRFGSTNPQWYSELYKDTKLGKPKIENAIDRIIQDAGKDTGKAVEVVKEKIMEILLDGGNGQPPDLYVLKKLGAPDDVMQDALKSYNEITGGNSSMDEALQSMGAPVEIIGENAGYFDDAGNFIQGINPKEPKTPTGLMLEQNLIIDEQARAQDSKALMESERFKSVKAKLAQLRAETGDIVDDTEGLIPAIPAQIEGATPTEGRAWLENKEGMTKALRSLEDGLLQRMGRRSSDSIDTEKISALDEITKTLADRTAMARLTASRVGSHYRDFTLHAYGETTNLDNALSLVLPYHFWYSRTYSSWSKRLVTNADTIAAYGKLKDYMAAEYRDQPEWYKYNVKFPDFFGTNGGNPYMFNLESAIWPLQGLTGVDFNDPQKRTNWATATIDDMSKFGPSAWSPIGMAVAAYYQLNGEKDIAAKWGGRLIPQTSIVKSVSSYFGNPLELDPNVQIFSGNGLGDFKAADPYEEGRIKRALSAMEAQGVPVEQLIDAARTQSGPLWEQAYIDATQQRAPAQLASAFLGVGFKPRTDADMQTDQFYGDYGRMRAMHENELISDEQYKQGFDKLREAYPFMDVILLSRRAGMGRENAYAYNVISRIPPGQSRDIFKLAGIDPDTAQKFYDSGGKMEGMGESEKDRFMAAMVDIGTMFAVPDGATRTEWTAAKDQYKNMQQSLKQQFGDDILDKISIYYGEDDKNQKKLYLEMNPDVSDAMDAQTEMIASDRQLMQYYGGLQTLETYYNSKMYDKLESQFGTDVLDAAREYSNSGTTKERKNELKAKFNLSKYWDEKAKLKDDNLRALVELGNKLPESPTPTLRTDANPQNPTQQELVDYTNPEPQITFDQWSGIIGPEVSAHVLDYWNGGKNLTSYDRKDLDYQAQQYGYDTGDDLLQAILISIK